MPLVERVYYRKIMNSPTKSGVHLIVPAGRIDHCYTTDEQDGLICKSKGIDGIFAHMTLYSVVVVSQE